MTVFMNGARFATVQLRYHGCIIGFSTVSGIPVTLALPYICLAAAAFITTLALTPLAKKIAVRVGAVDYPSKRRINTKPTPRLGGLAVFGGLIVACALHSRPRSIQRDVGITITFKSVGRRIVGELGESSPLPHAPQRRHADDQGEDGQDREGILQRSLGGLLEKQLPRPDQTSSPSGIVRVTRTRLTASSSVDTSSTSHHDVPPRSTAPHTLPFKSR